MEAPNKSRKRIDDILKATQLHEILDVKPDATKEELKKAYYKASLLVHPDKTNERGAREAFIKLANAYEDLKAGKKDFGKAQQSRNPKPEKKTPKRTTEPGSFDDIFQNFFTKKTHTPYVKKIQNNKMILDWYYKQYG